MKRSMVGLVAMLVVVGCSPARRTFDTHATGSLTWEDSAGVAQKLAGEHKLNVDMGNRTVVVVTELSDGQKCMFHADESSKKGTFVFGAKERTCRFNTAGGPITFNFDN